MKQILPVLLLLFLVACSKQPVPQISAPIDPNVDLVFDIDAESAGDMVNFGNLKANENKILAVQIKNTSNQTIQGPATLDQENGFSIIYSNGCIEIPAKKSCLMKISFSALNKSNNTYTSNLNLGNFYLALQSTVLNTPSSNNLEFSASSVNFGSINEKQSLSKTIQITNKGDSSVNSIVSGITNYTLSHDLCSNKSILPGKSCSLKISLSGANKSGTVSENLSFGGFSLPLTGVVVSSVGTSVLGSPNIVFLYGAREITTEPIATLRTGRDNQINLYLKNIGTASAPAGNITVNDSDYSIIFNQCTKPLLPDQSCQLRLVFNSKFKPEGTYSFTVSLGEYSKNISLIIGTLICPEGEVSQNGICLPPSQPEISYLPTYSTFGSCSKTQPCTGIGTQSRSIQTCQKFQNNILVGTTNLSDCSAFNNPTYLSQQCSSPSGIGSQTISNGVKFKSCLLGQTFAQGTFDHLECNEGFFIQGELCTDSEIITKHITVSKVDPDFVVNFSPAPISTENLTPDRTQVRYKFEESTVVNISSMSSSSKYFEYYLGDCTGTNPDCTLEMNSNKNIYVASKNVGQAFQLMDLNPSPAYMCSFGSANTMPNYASWFNSSASCEAPKNLEWKYVSCADYAYGAECDSYQTMYNCYSNSEIYPQGSSCANYSSNSNLCNSLPGCQWNNGSCLGDTVTSETTYEYCAGESRNLCFNNDLMQVMDMSESQCNSNQGQGFYTYAGTKGTFLAGALSQSLYLNGQQYILGDNSGSSLYSYISFHPQSRTHTLYPQTRQEGYLYGNALFNNKIYYMHSIPSTQIFSIKSFDGINTIQQVHNFGVISDPINNQFLGIVNNHLIALVNKNIYKISTSGVVTQLATVIDNIGTGHAISTANYVFACLKISNSIGKEIYKITDNGVSLVAEAKPGNGDGCSHGLQIKNHSENKILFSGFNSSNRVAVFQADALSVRQLHESVGNYSVAHKQYSPTLDRILTIQGGIVRAINNPDNATSDYLVTNIINYTGNILQGTILGEVNNKFIFTSGTAGNENAIYATDGTSGNLITLKTLNHSVTFYNSSYTVGGTPFANRPYGDLINGYLYFVLSNRYFYRTDGTAAGTVLVKDYGDPGSNYTGTLYWMKVESKLFIFKQSYFGELSGEIELFDPSLY